MQATTEHYTPATPPVPNGQSGALPTDRAVTPQPSFRVLYGFGKSAEFVSADAALMFAIRLRTGSMVERWDGERWRVWR